MAEHKHAEVLRAIADGKEVQWQVDIDEWDTAINYNPISHPNLNWRVKPKPDYFRYIGFDHLSIDASTTSLREFSASNWEYSIKITIDGETNEPKSVELIK